MREEEGEALSSLQAKNDSFYLSFPNIKYQGASKGCKSSPLKQPNNHLAVICRISQFSVKSGRCFPFILSYTVVQCSVKYLYLGRKEEKFSKS
jgi:hypothetical protein